MPKTIANSRNNVASLYGIVSLDASYLNQSVKTNANPTFNDLYLTGNAVVDGNITITGSTSYLETTITQIRDNIILINSDESGSGVTEGLSGLEVDRGLLPNYQSVFEESSQLFKIGTIGGLQCVATRADSPLDDGIMVYNGATGSLDSTQSISLPITFNSGTNSTSSAVGSIIVNGGMGVSQSIYLDQELRLLGSGNYASYIYADASSNLVINSGTTTTSINSNLSFSNSRGILLGSNCSVTGTGSALTISSSGTSSITSTGNSSIVSGGNFSITSGGTSSIISASDFTVTVQNTANMTINTGNNFTIGSLNNILITAANNTSLTTGTFNIIGTGNSSVNIGGGTLSITSGTLSITSTSSTITSSLAINLISSTVINIGTTIASVPVNIGNSNSDTTVNGNLVVQNNLIVQGEYTTIDTTVLTVSNNAIVVNSLPFGFSDGGFLVKRYQTPNNIGAGGHIVLDSAFSSSTFNSGSSTPGSLVLNSSETNTVDYYKGWWIYITSGAASGRIRRIKSYSNTRVATLYITADNTAEFLDGLDLDVAPSAGDTYNLYPGTYASLYYNDNLDSWVLGSLPYNTGVGAMPVIEYLDLTLRDLTIEGTLSAGISSPSMTTSVLVNIASISSANIKLITNGTEKIYSGTFLITPTSTKTSTSFNFTIPGLSFTNSYDIVPCVSGYYDSVNYYTIQNITSYATSSNLGKIRFTSGNSTQQHVIQFIIRY